MKDETIGVGDLVMVVRGHCAHVRAGIPHTVLELAPPPGRMYCGLCGDSFLITSPMARLGNGDYWWCPIPWLRKIPPLTEPEQVTEREELPA